MQQQIDLPHLETMHRLKTGALIRASVRMGALAAGATSAQLDALDRYAAAIGLSFQVQDDILDITSDTATLGKPQGSDIERDKPTYPALLGLAAAQQKAPICMLKRWPHSRRSARADSICARFPRSSSNASTKAQG